MSTEQSTESLTKPGRPAKSVWSILIPYIVAIVAQLPMLFLYAKDLWTSRPHYSFFPFAILATVILAWMRWPREKKMPFHQSTWSSILLFMGLGAGIAGVIFVEPWFAAFSVMLIISSLLARTADADFDKSLWSCSFPLFVGLVLPFGWDYRLITQLQRISANLTSGMLDLIGLGHHMTGTVIQVPGQEPYGIEQACSGVQSFFTLLFFAVVFIVLNRRPLFRAVALIGAAVFWAVFVNTVRIFMIPVADVKLGLDLVHGVSHDILGYTVLALGIFLLFSTDQFMVFLFGAVDPETGRSGPFGRLITWMWNGMLAGKTEEGETTHRKKSGRKAVSRFSQTFIWAAAGLLLLCGLWGLVDVYRSMSQPQNLNVRFFDADVTLPFEETDMPTEIEDWKLMEGGYFSEIRNSGSDLGQRSDVWQFRAPRCIAAASMDQTFPGWHELTTCYKNIGWELIPGSRQLRRAETLDGSQQWDYIEAEFRKETGERGFLVFSHFDAFGVPFEAPKEWGSLNSFFIRAQNRLSSRIRSRLFRGESYQTQVFVRSFGPFDEALKEEITSRYLIIRDQLRQKFLEKQGAEGTAPANVQTDAANADSKT